MLADHHVTFHLTDRPQMTITVPAGWKAHRRERFIGLTRDGRRVVIRPCPLERSERDMTGRHAMRHFDANVPVRGGGCLFASGPGWRSLKLRPELGPGDAVTDTDPAAEQLARDARKRTLGEVRATGTATATVGRRTWSSAWEWDLATPYFHQTQSTAGIAAEVVRRPDGNYVRYTQGTFAADCWGDTDSAEHDDALEPRLELQEWDAPPSSKTAWQVSYGQQPLSGGLTRVYWSGFVSDGEAYVGADGRLVSVMIRDHGQARGRTDWDTVKVTFAAFPAVVEPVQPEPRC